MDDLEKVSKKKGESSKQRKVCELKRLEKGVNDKVDNISRLQEHEDSLAQLVLTSMLEKRRQILEISDDEVEAMHRNQVPLRAKFRVSINN